ncbi:hypothetical protein DD594_26745, partial [Enterobacter cloacae complex sp. 4DZ1-17B1]|uniref:hypothetical protein n=1 Tax=Enterobacter cloacae complex sp. 4DZ1-17B1 TaxID=2511991 RepID=UPI001024B6F7
MVNSASGGGQLEDIGLDVDAADEVLGPLDEELVSRAIGDILPGEDELLAGITDGFDWMNLNTATEENEEFDLFSSGGGLEMDGETQDG